MKNSTTHLGCYEVLDGRNGVWSDIVSVSLKRITSEFG